MTTVPAVVPVLVVVVVVLAGWTGLVVGLYRRFAVPWLDRRLERELDAATGRLGADPAAPRTAGARDPG